MDSYTRAMRHENLVSARDGYVPRILGLTTPGLIAERNTMDRIRLPLRLMADSRYPVGWTTYPDPNRTLDALLGTSTASYDAVLFSAVAEHQALADACRAARVVVIVDVDSESFDREVVAAAGGVIVSSPALADLVRPYNTIIEVLPTYTDPRMWPREHDRISSAQVIGVFSWDSNAWQQLVDPLQQVKQDRADVVVMMDVDAPKELRCLADLDIPGATLSMLSEHRYRLSVDVGLCPSSGSVEGRESPRGIYAYGLAETAVIGGLAYAKLLRSKGTVASTGDEWLRAMTRYLDEGPRRRRDAFTLLRHVEDRTHIARHGDTVVAAYRAIYRRVLGEWFVAQAG